MVVERIYTSPTRHAAQLEHARIELRAGMGVVGDRMFGVDAYPGSNLTLVEAEEIERFCALHARPADLSITRRNLVTQGVGLGGLGHIAASVLAGAASLPDHA